MMLAEDEAKTKWCPFAVATSVDERDSAGVNRMRVNKPDPDCKCLASGCMAWRPARGEPSRGHCGLAGPVAP